MLDFSSNLIAAFRTTTSKPVFLLELEYNSGGSGNILRLAEKDLTCGSYQYIGALLSIGDLHQSADIVDFSTSTGNVRIKIANTPGAVWGKRFSELFSSCNFVNRSWRLFIWEEGLSSSYMSKIGEGFITSEIETTDEYCQITLVDYSAKYSRRLPLTLIDAETYPNAPANNFGKPIPMFFGDMDVDPNAPTTTCEFDRYFVKGRVPAVIVDQFSATDSAVVCYPDTETMKQLRAKNIFLGSQGKYCPCSSASVTGNPKITFSGGTWRLYVNLLSHTDQTDTEDYERIFDGIFTTEATITIPAETSGDIKFNIPKLPNLGEISKVYAIIKYGSTNEAYGLEISVCKAAYFNNMHPGTDERIDITDYYTDYLNDWTLNAQGAVINFINNNEYDVCVVTIKEMGLEIEFAPSESFVAKKYTINKKYKISRKRKGKPTEYEYGLRDIELVYISGKGRMYGTWIDESGASNARNDENGNAPDPGYNSGALIENPIYIVENICRTELGMDPDENYSDIDIESFDYAGSPSSSRGVYSSFGNYDPKFAFSVYQLIDSLDLIQKIGEQCNTWFFFSGDGYLKARTRNRASNYDYYDKIIDYNDITVTKISKTPLDKVFNDITIYYAKDYQSDNLTRSVHVESATSKGTTVNGYNQTLEYTLDADFINEGATASGLANAKLDFYQYQKNIIEFEIVNNFTYWDLEICDIIKFSNWDSNNPVNGETPGSSDYFSIFDISKSIDSGTLRIKCFEVS